MDAIIREIIAKKGNLNNEKIAKSMTYDHLFENSYFYSQISNYAEHTRIPLSVIDTNNGVRIMCEQTSFCNEILKSKTGKHLNNLGFVNNKKLAIKNGYCIFDNEFGLITGIFPIIIHNTITAYVYTGNLKSKELTHEAINSIAKTINLDPEILYSKYQDIETITYDNFKHYLLSLKLFIEQLSHLEFEKYKTKIYNIWNQSVIKQNDIYENTQSLLYENTSDAIFITKGNRILSYNPMAQHNIMMIENGNTQQYYLSDFLLEENIDFIQKNIDSLEQNKKFQSSFELKMRVGDGSIRWFDILILKHKYFSHEAEIYFLKNITKTKNTEEKLLKSNMMRKAIINRSSHCMIILDSHAKITDCNQQSIDSLDLDIKKLIGKKIDEIFPICSINSKAIQLFYENSLNQSKGKSECLITYNKRPNNWVKFSYEPIINTNDEFIGMQVQILNIQTIKDNEKETKLTKQIINEIVEVQNILVYLIDNERNIKYVSNTISIIDSSSKEQIIGKRFTTLSSHFSELCINKLLICHQSQEDSEFEYSIKDKNNEEIHYKAYAKNIFENNEYKGISLKCINISAQKAIQKKLQQQEFQFNELFEETSTIKLVLNTIGECTKVNKIGRKKFGIKKRTNLSKIQIKNYIKDTHEINLFIDNLKTSKNLSVITEQKLSIFGLDKRITWYNINIIPRYDSNKIFIGYLVLLTDISKQETKFENIKNEERKYKNLYNNGEVLTVSFSENMRITQMNQTAHNYFQSSEIDLQEIYYKEKLTSKEDTDIIDKAVQDTFIKGVPLFFEIKLIRHDWKAIWHKCSTTPIYDNQGRICEVMIQHMDITTNKFKEFELENSKLQFQQLTNGGYTQIYQTDENLRMIYVNTPSEIFFNVPLEKMIGQYLPDLAEPVTREKIITANNEHKRLTFEHEVTNFEGEKFWHKSTMSPLFNRDGKFIGNIFQCLDITDNIQKERELEKSRTNFMALVNSGQTLILQYDHSHNLVFVNDQAREFAGIGQEKVSILKITHYLSNNKDISVAKQHLQKAIRNKKSTQYDIQLKRHDKQNRWFSISITPHFDDTNHLITYFIEGIDITESKKRQLVIEKNAQFLSKIANIGTLQLLQLDKDLKVIYANKEVLKFADISLEELNKAFFLDFVNEDVRYYTNLTKQTKQKHHFEHEIIDAKGNVFWHTTYMTPLIDQNNEFDGLIIQCTDTSEAKYARDKIEKSERRFKYLANSGDILIQEFSPKGVCLYANDITLKTFSLDKTIIGKHASDIDYLEHIYEGFNNKFTAIYSKRDTHLTFETEIIRNNISTWLKCYCAPTVDEYGDYTGVLIQSMNITSIKTKENALINQNILFNNIKENEHTNFWILDKNGKFDFASQKLLEILGYSTIEEINNAYQNNHNPFFENQRIINRAIEGKTFTDYSKIVLKNGSTRWYYTSIIPITNKEKKFNGLIGYAYDTTDIIQERNNLKEKLETFYQLTNNISAIIFQVDSSGTVLDISDNIFELSDHTFSKNDFINKNILAFKYPIIAEKLINIWHNLQENKGYFSDILFWENQNRRFASRFNIVPYYDSQKSEEIYFGYIVDESKWMESKKVIEILQDILLLVSKNNTPIFENQLKKSINETILKNKYIHQDFFHQETLQYLSSIAKDKKIVSDSIKTIEKTLGTNDNIDILKLFEFSSIGYLTYNTKNEIINFNPMLQKLFPGGVVFKQQKIETLFENNENLNKILEFNQKLEEKENTLRESKFEFLNKGQIIPIHCLGYYNSKTKHYLLLLNNLIEIQDLKNQKEELANKLILCNSIFKCPYFTIDGFGNIIQTSKNANNILSTRTSNSFSSIFDIIPTKEKHKVESLIKDTLINKKVSKCNIQIKKLNNTIFYEIRMSVISNNRNEQKILVYFINVTDKKELKNHLIQNEKMASLGEMTTAMIHEINQPLLSISLSLDNLFARLFKKAPDQFEYLKKKNNHLFSDIERIGKLIDHLRLYSRNETNPGSSEIQMKLFNVNNTVNNALAIISEQLKIHGFVVEVNLEETLPKIYGNTYRLEQVILNFISNARDAINQRHEKIALKDPKKIIIKTYFDTNYVMIAVTDNGVGIPNEIKTQVLDTFFSTKGEKGVGIGLSISKSIMDEFHGSIEIDSDGKTYTTMTAKIPTDKQKYNKN